MRLNLGNIRQISLPFLIDQKFQMLEISYRQYTWKSAVLNQRETLRNPQFYFEVVLSIQHIGRKSQDLHILNLAVASHLLK